MNLAFIFENIKESYRVKLYIKYWYWSPVDDILEIINSNSFIIHCLYITLMWWVGTPNNFWLTIRATVVHSNSRSYLSLTIHFVGTGCYYAKTRSLSITDSLYSQPQWYGCGGNSKGYADIYGDFPKSRTGSSYSMSSARLGDLNSHNPLEEGQHLRTGSTSGVHTRNGVKPPQFGNRPWLIG